jgi:hypothetical protein
VIAGAEAKIAHGPFTATRPGLEPARGDLVIFVGGGRP